MATETRSLNAFSRVLNSKHSYTCWSVVWVVSHASDVAGNEAIGSTAVSRCEAEDEDACAGPGMDCEADPGSEAPDILQVFRVRLTGMVRQMCHDGAGKDKLEPKMVGAGGCVNGCKCVCG